MGSPSIDDYKYEKFINAFASTDINQTIGIALFGIGRAGKLSENFSDQSNKREILNTTSVAFCAKLISLLRNDPLE
jgi:hypothetical protein